MTGLQPDFRGLYFQAPKTLKTDGGTATEVGLFMQEWLLCKQKFRMCVMYKPGLNSGSQANYFIRRRGADTAVGEWCLGS